MTRSDEDFPFLGDADCDGLAATMTALPHDDTFSVRRAEDRPLMLSVRVWRHVEGRGTARVEIDVPVQIVHTEPVGEWIAAMINHAVAKAA